MTPKVGYARVSTDDQNLTAQRDVLVTLDVAPDRIYVDHGLTPEPTGIGPGCLLPRPSSTLWAGSGQRGLGSRWILLSRPGVVLGKS
ncbi:MAG: hypothetical protein L0H64_02395 [Pseudonocardia sp.]|nr:hypothetical protein [Pseudonocardia sp.]